MADKAAAVGALITSLDVPSAIDVTTPDRPAVSPQGAAEAPPDADPEASLEGEG